MAATNLKAINRSDKDHMYNYHGTGAIVVTDTLVTDIKTYPKGTTYVDTTNRVLYVRTAETSPAGAIGDYSKVTLTAHT